MCYFIIIIIIFFFLYILKTEIAFFAQVQILANFDMDSFHCAKKHFFSFYHYSITPKWLKYVLLTNG